MRLFVDMDGVLADFDAHYEAIFGVRPDKWLDNADWKKVRESKDFYLNIPPMVDMATLWKYVLPHNPIILTGVPRSVAEASDNKIAWVRRHLGNEIEVRCVLSREKCLSCRPGDVLIDDWGKHKDKWINAGGIWITHRSAAETIIELESVIATQGSASASPLATP